MAATSASWPTSAARSRQAATGRRASFSPDGRRLAIAVLDGTVRIVATDGRGPEKRLNGHYGYVYSARFSPDGSRLVTASQDATARIWDLASGTSRTLTHADAVESATFSPDGKHVATAGGDGVLRVWDADAPGAPRTVRFGRPALLSARYSPDGRRIVTAGIDGIVRVVDVRTLSIIAVFTGHRGQATQADFIDNGDAVVSVGEDGTLRTWASSHVIVIPAYLESVSLSPSGRFVTGADQSGAVAIWDLETGARRSLWRHAATSFVKFSADGAHIASASWDGTVRVGEPDGGAVQRVRAGGLAKYSVALDRHATRVAFGGSDSDPRVVIVSIGDGRRVVLRGHTEIVWDIDFSPDGTHVVTASEDGTARLWNASNGHLERTLEGHGEGVTTARYSPGGKSVVTAGKDGTARVWPVTGGSPRILRGHAGPVSSAAFNARGDRIVTAGADGTVRVWSSRGGDPLITVDMHLDEARGAAFTPDGRRAVSVGADGVIRAVGCDVCGPFPSVLSLARARSRMNLSAADQRRHLPQGG